MVDLERQYNCNTCGAIFSSTNEMNIHVKKFHEQAKRNECKTQCFGQRSLFEHIKFFHNEAGK